jgi:sulfur carrier protein ThiS
VRVHLGGHLSWYEPQRRSWLEVDLPEAATLAEVINRLGVPREEIAVGVVNGRVVDLDATLISATDQVELYPPVGGGGQCSYGR